MKKVQIDAPALISLPKYKRPVKRIRDKVDDFYKWIVAMRRVLRYKSLLDDKYVEDDIKVFMKYAAQCKSFGDELSKDFTALAKLVKETL